MLDVVAPDLAREKWPLWACLLTVSAWREEGRPPIDLVSHDLRSWQEEHSSKLVIWVCDPHDPRLEERMHLHRPHECKRRKAELMERRAHTSGDCS